MTTRLENHSEYIQLQVFDQVDKKHQIQSSVLKSNPSEENK